MHVFSALPSAINVHWSKVQQIQAQQGGDIANNNAHMAIAKKVSESLEEDFNKDFSMKNIASAVIRSCNLLTCAALTRSSGDWISPPSVLTHVWALSSSLYSGGPCSCYYSHMFWSPVRIPRACESLKSGFAWLHLQPCTTWAALLQCIFYF